MLKCLDVKMTLFAIIILFIGFMGMSVIVIRKIPVLAELSVQQIKGTSTFGKIREKIRNNRVFKSVSKGILLQKILSKVRIFLLRIDDKTNNWLIRLRQKSLKNRSKFSNDFWQKVKKGK